MTKVQYVIKTKQMASNTYSKSYKIHQTIPKSFNMGHAEYQNILLALLKLVEMLA